MIYAVIDTNVIVSAFITHQRDSATVKVMERLYRQEIVALYDEDILAEYREVLSRRKFNISSEAIQDLISFLYAYGINAKRIPTELAMPDETDRVFYEISLSKEESFLVTGNIKHYPVSPKIVTPGEFIKLHDF